MANLTPFQNACTAHFGSCFQKLDKRKAPDATLLSNDEAVAGVVVWFVDSFADMILKPAVLLADMEPDTKATDKIEVMGLHTGSIMKIIVGQTYISRAACKDQDMPSGFDDLDIETLKKLAGSNPNPAPLKKGEKKEPTVAKTEKTEKTEPKKEAAPKAEAKPKVTRGSGKKTEPAPQAVATTDDLPPMDAPETVSQVEDSLPPMEEEGGAVNGGVEVVEEDHTTEVIGDDLPPMEGDVQAGGDEFPPMEGGDQTSWQGEADPAAVEPGKDSLDADDIKVLFDLKLSGRRNSFKLQELLGVKEQADGAKVVANLMGRLVDLGLVDTEGEKRGKTYGITAAGLEALEGVDYKPEVEPVAEKPAKAKKEPAAKEEKPKDTQDGKAIEIPAWTLRGMQEVVDQLQSITKSMQFNLDQMKDGKMTAFPGDALQSAANAVGVIQGGILRLRLRGMNANGSATLDPTVELPKIETMGYVNAITFALVAPEKVVCWQEVQKQAKLIAEKGKTMVNLLKTPGMEKSVADFGEPLRTEDGERLDAGTSIKA